MQERPVAGSLNANQLKDDISIFTYLFLSVNSSFIYHKYTDKLLCVKVAYICCNLHLKVQKHCLIWVVTCSLPKIAEFT